MGDPVSLTMAGISMAASAGGGILGAMGAAKKDEATQAMDLYKAQVAQANQQIAMRNAQYEMALGEKQAQIVGLKGQQTMGQITAEQGASGLRVGSGSAAEVQRSQMAGITTSEATTMADAQRRAYGYETQAYGFGAEAGLDIQAAKYAQSAEGLDIASSLLGGAGSVADKWMSYSRAGVFGGQATG